MTAPLAGVPGWSEEIFRGNVTKNLQAGTFKLIIAVDQVTRELVRTLVWLNSHTVSDVRVLAAGLHQVADDGVTMLPPMVFGDEYVDRVPPRIPRPRPSRKLLVDGIAARSTFDAGAAEAVLDWAESKHPRLRIRYTPKDGVIETEAGETLLRIVRHSEVRVSPDNFADRWSDEQTEELLRDYEDLELRLEGTKLRAPLEALTDEGRRTRFLEQVLETLTT